MPFTYDHPRPSVTVDVVAICVQPGATARLLVIQRARPPFAGRWALPGGFLDIDEELETAALRELGEETGVASPAPLLQVGAFGAPDRDPRGRTVSVAFAVLLVGSPPLADAGDDARTAAWRRLDRLPPLAFDHQQVVQRAIAALALRTRADDGLAPLLPAPFTLLELHAAHAAVDAETPEPDRFARRLRPQLAPVGGGARRGRARLFRARH